MAVTGMWRRLRRRWRRRRRRRRLHTKSCSRRWRSHTGSEARPARAADGWLGWGEVKEGHLWRRRRRVHPGLREGVREAVTRARWPLVGDATAGRGWRADSPVLAGGDGGMEGGASARSAGGGQRSSGWRERAQEGAGAGRWPAAGGGEGGAAQRRGPRVSGTRLSTRARGAGRHQWWAEARLSERLGLVAGEEHARLEVEARSARVDLAPRSFSGTVAGGVRGTACA